LSNILNPKVAVFYLAFLPQFINAGDPVLAKSLLLAGIHFVLGIVWLSLVTIFVAWLRASLTQPAIRRGLETVTGVVLIAFGIRLALEKQ
jgi:threonine/homoserine/homoserine lactone efflux protein